MGFMDWLTGGSNKRADALSAAMPTYSGYRPPHVNYLRPVEDQIYDILMKRSRSEDVGYDPRRRELLLQNFKLQQDRDLQDTTSDINNRLSGMGLSRNAAAYDEMMGRALRDAQREKNLYTNRVDIEDLARRNEERDINTSRLQDFNTFNFGQENTRANFDLDAFKAESANELGRRNIALGAESFRESPLSMALKVGSVASGFVPGGAGYQPASVSVNQQSPTYSPSGRSYGGAGYGDTANARRDYLNKMALQSGYNFAF